MPAFQVDDEQNYMLYLDNGDGTTTVHVGVEGTKGTIVMDLPLLMLIMKLMNLKESTIRNIAKKQGRL